LATASVSTAPARRVWIVSAWWDLVYLIATPLLIVPVALMASRQWLTPEQVYLAAISFASLGHHLPGFMRAYGDRELFHRFRTRFLLAPPLVLAMALLFSPPSRLREALHLPWNHLHGLELILFVWGTWHGLMQTYGFMRIYDLRRGENDRRAARLDHALCLAMFIAGVVFSDGRMFEIAGVMWQTGLPLFDHSGLVVLRWVVGTTCAVVGALYAFDLLRRRASGLPINGVKLLLALTAGWFYWYCGRINNLLVGVAMFEIYHAVQYNAIVWIYNRRLFERVRNRFGPLGFLFRDRVVMLCTYLAAIGAYSSIRFFTAEANDRMFRGDNLDAHQWLIALFVTSSFLHFYYDGFIWKVSEKKTQDNLVDATNPALSFDRFVPGLVHAGRWAVLLAIAAALIIAERAKSVDTSESAEVARLRAIAQLTPNLPEAMAWQVIEALDAGDTGTAVDLARRAAQMRPRSHQDQARLADALMVAGNCSDAAIAWQRAVDLHPKHWPYRVGLAEALERADHPEAAEAEMKLAVQLGGDLVEPRRHLAELYRRLNRPADAVEPLQEVVEQLPQNADLRVALGGALAGAGQFGEAIAELTKALKIDPNSAEGNYRLGLAILQSGDPGGAIAPLQRAVTLDPEHLPATLLLGDAFYSLQKWRPAMDAYRRAVEVDPDEPDAWVNLASTQLNAGDRGQAEATLRKGLRRLPDSSALQFTLGYLLTRTGRSDEGEALLERAKQAGVASPNSDE